MSPYPADALAHALPWAAGAVVFVLVVTFAASRIAGKHSVIDTAWGVMFVAIAVAVFATSAGQGDDVRRALLLVLPTVWGLRLAQHIARRTIGKPEDPRYAELLAKAKGRPGWYALRVVYLTQGGLAFVIAAPILVGGFERGPVRVIGAIGVALWVLGVWFEAVGDAQLERFRNDPSRAGNIMNTGLWRYTRHPNYFGDACVWWGIYLIAAERWPGVLTLPAPVLMTLLLTKGSGARILERHMAGRPGWADYVARTSGFVPRPPRRL
ncbi:MAG TPA: DUF1295 domain-containing protein [Jatrophihabitantaceae bacterium]|nr:DUF1295 domain-containing protein [Jatrophihabitantaceae bacterium]